MAENPMTSEERETAGMDTIIMQQFARNKQFINLREYQERISNREYGGSPQRLERAMSLWLSLNVPSPKDKNFNNEEFTRRHRNGGGAGVGGRKRKSKRKTKAHMTKQKRKVNGVTRTVRVSSTGRKYVLLKGRKHYL